jgi:hypothetical protein
MKKLYLSITLLAMVILMFMITLIPVQASTYNDPVSGLNITLNTEIPILGNRTLGQVYFVNNLLNSENFLDNNNDGLYNAFDLPALINQNTTYDIFDDTQYFFNPDYSNIFSSSLKTKNIPQLDDSTKLFYISYYSENVIGLVGKAEFLRNTETNNILFNLGDGRQSYLFNTFGNTFGYSYIVFYRDQTEDQLILRNFVLLDLSDLSLTNVSRVIIDYYYNLYVLLKAGFSPEVFYEQGLGVGYGNGLEDYHYGNYNYLDPLDGVPYNQGFNEGRDDAIDNNFTLMGLVELIIGVVLSMVGWIINIEVFEISIIGILSTLAIGISFIWLLKILRG